MNASDFKVTQIIRRITSTGTYGDYTVTASTEADELNKIKMINGTVYKGEGENNRVGDFSYSSGGSISTSTDKYEDYKSASDAVDEFIADVREKVSELEFTNQ